MAITRIEIGGQRIRYATLSKHEEEQVNATKGVVLEGAPIVRDYHKVFPEELPDMP